MKKLFTLFVVAIFALSAMADKTIYFRNTVNWSSVYVYADAYWDTYNNLGAGSNGHSYRQMQLVDGYDDLYVATFTDTELTSSHIAFTEADQNNYNNYYQTKAAYREDYNISNPIFVPNTSSNETKNETQYYSNGNWRNYPINVIWTNYITDGALGGSASNMYMVEKVANLGIDIIQKPGFAQEAGIYVSVPAGISSCNVESAIQGAGIVLYLSSFSSQITEVTIDYAGGSITFQVWNESGTPVVPDEEAPSISVATADPITYRTATINITATDNIGVTKYEVYNGEELIATSNQNPIVATGLDAEAQYTLTIFAYDKAGNRSQGFDVTFTTAAAPQGQALVNGEHAVLLSGVHYANTHVYELTITSEEKMDGLGGSFWYLNGVSTDVRKSMTQIDDNTIKFTVVSNQAPQLHTPLYILMPGEVNFGETNIVWVDKNEEPADQATISVSSVGYTTYFNSLKGYEMPQNMEGYIFNKESLSIEKKYEAGQYVPAGEALVLKATDGDYKFFFAKGGQKSDNNALLGTDAQTAIEADANAYFYALSLDENDQNVGFYWMNETGAAFTNGAHKAYLKLDKSLFETPSQPNAAPRRFVFDQAGIATDVDAIEADNDVVKFFENGQLLIKKNGVIYNAMGQIVK